MKLPIRLIFLSSFITVATLLTGCVDPSSSASTTGFRTGQEVRDLPRGSLTETVNGTRYYNYDGTYFRSRNNRFEVVDPPTGKRSRSEAAYVDRLPPGKRMMKYGGENYFLVGDTYYKQLGAGYVIVDRPF